MPAALRSLHLCATLMVVSGCQGGFSPTAGGDPEGGDATPGEACADGDDCDAPLDCTGDCGSAEPAVLCGAPVVELGPEHLVDADHYQVWLTLAGEGSLAWPEGCVDKADLSAAEMVVVLRAPADGWYRARTELEGRDTETDSVIYVHTAGCDGAAVACSDDFDEAPGGLVHFAATAGDPSYIVVDSFASGGGPVWLDIAAVPVVTAGAACDGVHEVCAPPAVCVHGEYTWTCETPQAPELVGLRVRRWTGSDGYVYFEADAQGSDANLDARSVVGALRGPGVLDAPFDTFFMATTYDGVDFRITSRAARRTSATVLAYDSLAAGVQDDTGLETATWTVPIADSTVAALGAPCDGWGARCEPGASCLWGTCAVGLAAPNLLTAAVFWRGPQAIEIQARGTDDDGDVAGLELVFLDAGGAALDAPAPGRMELLQDNTGRPSWTGSNVLSVNGVPHLVATVALVRAQAIDHSGNLSPETLELPIPWPTVAALGEACDADSQLRTCASGTLCDDVLDGAGSCRAARLDLERCYYLSPTTLAYVVETQAGIDLEKSIAGLYVDRYAGADNSGTFTYSDETNRSLYGVVWGRVLNTDAPARGTTHVLCYFVTYDHAVSPLRRAPWTTTPRGLGATCEPPGGGEVCREGLVCADRGDGPRCYQGEAPRLTAWRLRRPTADVITVELDLVDADGDLQDAWVSFVDAAGIPVWTLPVAVPFDRDLTGEVAATATVDPIARVSDYAGMLEAVLATETLQVTVFDTAGLSFPFSVPINLEAGAACSLAPGSVPCAAGQVCDASAASPVCAPAP